MKRLITAIAAAIALAIPVATVTVAHDAPVAGGYGDWPF